MVIKNIEIINVKGIHHSVFNLELIPNKPNILVAPNGFGKSSFAIGFDSLKRNKIELDKKHFYLNNERNRPILSLTIEDTGVRRRLTASDTQNTISDEIDVFVINSQLMAKAIKMKIHGNTIVKSSLEISPIVLVPTIPVKSTFNYSSMQAKRNFGINGKILPNISDAFTCAPLISKIVNEIDLSKFSQVKISTSLKAIQDQINLQTGTTEDIKNWIEVNKLTELKSITEFNAIASIIAEFDIQYIQSLTDSFLAAYQFVYVYQIQSTEFRKAVNYTLYLDDKEYYENTISNFNTTRHTIKPKEDKKHGLVVEWPKAHEISNGQRDVLSFVTLLMKAKRNFKKANCILIIDEIFDYLDDANLISFQYFITDIIEHMKAEGKNFFPILMTHLDPLYFNHFCFNRHKIKVVYLKDIPTHPNINILNLIRKREDPSIQTLVDKHHFHFYPTHIDLSTQFSALSLPGRWGNSENFHQIINAEATKYLSGQANFCPLAICFGVRIKIESIIYNKITDPVHKQKFLDLHGTKKKLDYCEEIGVDVPEVFYLLGIIYNDNLHIRHGLDFTRPVAIKLENLTIKKMIHDIFK
jgi:hypothetical protein